MDEKIRSPTSSAEKGFLMSKGKIILECTLDKEIYYHGQEIPINVAVHNNSNKSVKSIRVGLLCKSRLPTFFRINVLQRLIFQVGIIQHCELTMVGAQYCCKVARLETKDGCPLNPGANLNRTFTMKPLAQMCAHERGLALDASLSKVIIQIIIIKWFNSLMNLHKNLLI